MKKITLTLLALACALCCALGLVACSDGNNTGDGGSDTIAVESVTLNKDEITLDIDDEETLTATVTPDNATNKTVTWSSSAPTIASVDNTGKVTAVVAGTATITATTANNKTATCAVTVNAPAPTTEVTAEQWQSALSQAQNYTIEYDDTAGGELIKYDGTSIEMPEILTKDGENYYEYRLDGSAWTRSAITSSSYEDMKSNVDYFTHFFADKFTSFDPADGKYICTTLNSLMGDWKNIEIVFENGALKSIKFEMPEGPTSTEYTQCEIKNIGTTTIEIPTEYTESN